MNAAIPPQSTRENYPQIQVFEIELFMVQRKRSVFILVLLITMFKNLLVRNVCKRLKNGNHTTFCQCASSALYPHHRLFLVGVYFYRHFNQSKFFDRGGISPYGKTYKEVRFNSDFHWGLVELNTE